MPRIPIHPGEHLADELQELGISARELARTIKVPTTRITDILRGRRGLPAILRCGSVSISE
jgi:addiction module HigA family antidote